MEVICIFNKGVLVAREEFTAHRQSGATVSLLKKRKNASAAEMMSNFINEGGSSLETSSKLAKKATTTLQPSIEASMQASSVRDVRDCNNAALSIAIADMIHCENLPEKLVSSVRFRRVLQLSRLVTSQYRYL